MVIQNSSWSKLTPIGEDIHIEVASLWGLYGLFIHDMRFFTLRFSKADNAAVAWAGELHTSVFFCVVAAIAGTSSQENKSPLLHDDFDRVECWDSVAKLFSAAGLAFFWVISSSHESESDRTMISLSIYASEGLAIPSSAVGCTAIGCCLALSQFTAGWLPGMNDSMRDSGSTLCWMLCWLLWWLFWWLLWWLLCWLLCWFCCWLLCWMLCWLFWWLVGDL